MAAARKLAVDLWRLATGQTTPEKLKLKMSDLNATRDKQRVKDAPVFFNS